MRKSIQLELPLVKAYPDYASVFSVVAGKTTDYLPWVYNYFVVMRIPSDPYFGLRVDYCTPILSGGFPWLNYEKVSRNLVDKKWNSFSRFLIDCLDCDRAAYFLIDVYGLPLYQQSNDYYHETHDIFVYGYDTSTNEFLVADNFPKYNGKYTYSKCNCDELEKAYQGVNHFELKDWLNGVKLFSSNEVYDHGLGDIRSSYEYEFSIETYCALLKDQLESKCPLHRFHYPQRFYHKKFVYGLSVYDRFIDYLEEYCNDLEITIEYRGVYCLYEHAMLSLQSLRYLVSTRAYLKLDLLVPRAEEIVRILKKTQSLAIKYNLTRDTNLLRRICSLLSRTKSLEKDYIVNLLDTIESSK